MSPEDPPVDPQSAFTADPPPEDLDFNLPTRAALAEAGAEVVGTARRLDSMDLLLVRGDMLNRSVLRKLESRLRKANPQWRGVLLHMPPGMEFNQLPAVMVESLYEALMYRFDPHLLAQRTAARQAAEARAKVEEEARILAEANAVADHLGEIQNQIAPTD